MTDNTKSDSSQLTIIEQLFYTLKQDGIEASLEKHVNPDAVFIGVREEKSDHIPIYGSYAGHSQITRFFDTLNSCFDTHVFEINHSFQDDTIAIATGYFHHKTRLTSRDFRSHWACLCHLGNGKISQYRFYEDTAALEASLTPFPNL
ncbi:nuclear transport factor 2 family protein [Cohaesibacter gelatinilyticus]|uniref:Ketosteroid isomerase-related protein n=1 Tax=Cohaesibacter gelatinilyticus TaxID=372072 RepID=A0A285PIP8_9HYPH|nr:nuclear transport factor 2 family protein [Cohaesibacter gelatinilyticus]SNZ21602.1 Ketosteroid isomerase-related protein [Cohaesibacter gelatinilyticus]